MIKGKVTGENFEALPFATLYISGTTKGTTTNIEGNYSFDLAPGEYELIFQYVGYVKSIHKIILTEENISLDVNLKREVFELQEVVITANGEDPAYPVIRAAIKKRKYHIEEVQAYNCNVYIKGMQTLKEKRDKLFGYTVPVDTGIVYLSESISEFSFERPGKIKEIMVSSKVSGNITNFSYNQGSQMLISFYDNLIKVSGLSERSFVSPISANAFLFYEYKLEGVTTENDLLINKIKVIPKRKNDPVFEGYIYILEDLWKIHSVDLTLTKEHQIEFMNRMTIQQVFAPVYNDIWMMISQKFNYELDAFGFKGEGNFVGVHSNYKIQPKDYPSNTSNSTGFDKILFEDLFSNNYFNNEILTINKDANEKDSSYWNTIRPIPLTDVELADYQKNDSLKTVYSSRAYKDSVDNYVNKISLSNVLYSGYTYQKSFKEQYFQFEPIIKSVQYNTVEGWVLNVSPIYSKFKDNIPQFRIMPDLRYGFSSKQFYGALRGDLYLDPIKYSKIYGGIGKFVSQLNNGNPISAPINSFETLFRRNNYLKLYEKDYAKIGYISEIKNGITIHTSMTYEDRSLLKNTDSYSFFGDNDITSNQPSNIEAVDTSFQPYQSLQYFLKLRFDFKRKYLNRPDGKIILDSPYPRLEIYYRKGLSILGAETNYDQLSALIAGDLPAGLVGESNYMISAGTFLNKKKMFFPDYTHFNSDFAVISNFNTYKFQLLDYYKFSTTSRFYNFNFRHHFNGFLINKIPFLRKSKVQAVGSFSYLNTIALGNYFEYGIGFEHIFKILRLDYYSSNIDGNFYRQGVRIGIGF